MVIFMNDEKKQLGILRRYFPQKGYGFLACATRAYDNSIVALNDRSIPDVFVHHSDAARCGIESLAQGDVYEFEIGADRKTGRPKAQSLRRVAP
jgi:cold shock CspA family protein